MSTGLHQKIIMSRDIFPSWLSIDEIIWKYSSIPLEIVLDQESKFM